MLLTADWRIYKVLPIQLIKYLKTSATGKYVYSNCSVCFMECVACNYEQIQWCASHTVS